MPDQGVPQHPIGTVEVDGRRFTVSLRTAYDGVEHVGRLWFAELEGASTAIPDHGAISGATAAEAVASARQLTHDDLARRCRRAHAEKRRYIKLRRATDEILAKVKYMNRVAISMKAGLIDHDGGDQELGLIEEQIIAIVKQLRTLAGVEE